MPALLAEKLESKRAKKMFVFNRDAVRELRRQLAPVVALLSNDKERVVRLVSYMRRGHAMIGGGGGGASSALVKNEAIQSAAAATSATTPNNNVDDESISTPLSAVDCGEWLLGRVFATNKIAKTTKTTALCAPSPSN